MSDTVPVLIVAAILANLILALITLRGIESVRSVLSLLIQKLDVAKREDSTFKVEGGQSSLGRRAKYRAETQLQGEMTVEGRPVEVQIQDLSETGAMILCDETALKQGASYPLKFRIKSGSGLQLDVHVVRVIKENHYGVCFENLTLESKARIREYVSSFANNALTEVLKVTSK